MEALSLNGVTAIGVIAPKVFLMNLTGRKDGHFLKSIESILEL